MSKKILKLLSFRVSGQYAHFRKFYTNSSSLSYLVPPRTVIIGMLASILGYARDSYYELFNPQKIKISVNVTPGTIIKKKINSLNYLSHKYHNFLCKGSGDNKNMHSQCKLELLLSGSRKIDYTIYVGAIELDSLPIIDQLETKISNQDFGFGVYLGQRQFRADIDNLETFGEQDIGFSRNVDYTNTIFIQGKGEPDMGDERNLYSHILVDQMPIHMEKESASNSKKKAGRLVQSVKRVGHEKSGKPVYGKFEDGYYVRDKVVTFFED